MLGGGEGDEIAATELAHKLGLSLLPRSTDLRRCNQLAAVLLFNGPQLFLQQTGVGAPGAIAADLGSPAMGHRRRSGANEVLGRDVGGGKKIP